MEKTYFSKRIHKNTLSEEVVSSIQDTLLVFNRAKHWTYQQLLHQHRGKEKQYDVSEHIKVKELFQLNDYYANSVVQDAKAILRGQKELHKMYIDDVKNQIKTSKKKVKDLERQWKNKQKILNSIIKGGFKAYKGSNESQQGTFYTVRRKNKVDLYYNLYDFEHVYLKPLMKQIDTKIRLIKFRIQRLERKLENLSNGYMKGATFGSKDFFKKQFDLKIKCSKKEYDKKHVLWKKEYQDRRYSSMRISGRKDAKYGNFVFKYNYENFALDIMFSDGKIFKIDEVIFPYGQENVDKALRNQKTWKKPIAWEVEDHGDYYIFKAMVYVPENQYVNYSKSSGVIGIDCNYDHLARSETDSTGNLIDTGVIPFSLYGKSTNQVTYIIEHVAKDMLDIASNKKKPIVVERLDTTNSKSNLRYRNKLSNRKITQFAYRQLLDSLINRADKVGVGVFQVSPAFTSVIGKVKYMKPKGLSIHQSAAYVIARRGMYYKEKVPPVLFNLLPEKITCKHHWTHWNTISRYTKNTKPHSFYSSALFLDVGSLKEWASHLEKYS